VIQNSGASQAIRLLLAHEVVPREVQLTEQFFRDANVWYILSRNDVARSCREASHNRNRLGHKGIPLWDEMKSALQQFERKGVATLVLAHCRADQRLDHSKLTAILGADGAPQRVDELTVKGLGLEYGLVNPWGTWNLPKISSPEYRSMLAAVEHVFDEDLLNPIGTPGSVMTNAGAFDWGIEFHPSEVVGALKNVRVGDITEPDPDEAPRLWGTKDERPIGVITGNPPDAGIMLWQRINEQVRAILGDRCCGDISMPRMEIISVPELGLSMELDRRFGPVERAIKAAVRSMIDADVKVVSLPCNTTSFFSPMIHEMCKGTRTRFMSMAEVTGSWLRERRVSQVALVGINYVADLGHWSAYREPLQGIEIELLSSKGLDEVRELAYEVKAKGAVGELLTKLRDVIKRHVQSQHVVLALTELSLLAALQRGSGKSRKELIDPMELYATAIARAYFDLNH